MKLALLPGMDFVTLILYGSRVALVELVAPSEFVWTLCEYRKAMDFETAANSTWDQDEVLACAGAV